MIWLPALAVMLVDSSSVAPLMACRVPLLMKLPLLAGGTMFSVAPLMSAEIRPLLVSTLTPPTIDATPILPWPRTVIPAPSVVLPLPSIDRRVLASLRLMTALPLIVWMPPGVALLSRLRKPPLARLIAPLRVAPLMMRSRELTMEPRSSVPVKSIPLRTLLPLLVAVNTPVPLALITPLMATPFCTTELPAPAMIWLPALAATLVDSSSVPPLTACRVPLLTKLPLPPGGVILSVPPATSAEIRPLLVSVLVPPTLIAVPMLPWPRTVMPEPSVVLPLPSIARRAPGSLRLMTAVPPMVWMPVVVFALSRVRMPPLAMLIAPLIVAPLMMRSRELATLVMSMTALTVALSR